MAPLTSKGKSWEFANSLWMIGSWIPMIGFISFLYIALRAKQAKWFAWGVVYFVPWILTFVLPDSASPEGDWTVDVWMAAVLLAWLGSAFHAFRVRKEYLMRLAAIEELRWREEQDLKNRIQLEYDVDLNKPLQKAVKEQAATPPKTADASARPSNVPRQRILNNEADPAPAQAPVPARATAEHAVAATASPSSEPAPVEAEEPPTASEPTPALPPHPIDLNTATEAELALLPGVGEILAMRAVSEREVRGGFRSVEEFIKAIGLRPEVIERIRPYAFVTPKK